MVGEVTVLPGRARGGDTNAAGEPFGLCHDELGTLAGALSRREVQEASP